MSQRANSIQAQSKLLTNPGDPYTTEAFLPGTSTPLVSDAVGNDCPPCWWFVTAHALEVIRTNNAPATPLLPLSDSTLRSDGKRRSHLRVRLSLADETKFSRVIDCDLGPGITLAWWGRGVQVDLLFRDGAPISEHPQGRTGAAIADSMVEASLARTAGSYGTQRPLILTDVRDLAASSPFLIPIPSGAVRVGLLSSASPTAIEVAFRFDPPVSTSTGRVILPTGVPLPSVPVPGQATALEVLVPNNVTGSISAVWEIAA